MKISLVIVILMVMVGLYSCSNDETIVTPPTNDTLSYSFSNLNDTIITINYAIGGSTSSQTVQYTLNLNKPSLNMRFNMTNITSGNMKVQMAYDTTKRQAFTLSSVVDSMRYNLTGPANSVVITPTNFKGRGTIIISK